jgi:hypothetical protein
VMPWACSIRFAWVPFPEPGGPSRTMFIRGVPSTVPS